MQTFKSVISLWPTVAAFAADVGAKERTAMSWWQRDSIPAEWFRAVAGAASRQFSDPFRDVTVETLAAIAERKRLAPSRQPDNQAAA